MVEVEIDDGHALGPVLGLRMKRRHRRVVEEAEAHRLGDFGVMAGRPHWAERVARAPPHYLVDGVDSAARRAKRRLPASGRDDRVAFVERDKVGPRLLFFEKIDIGSGMRARHLVERCERRLHGDEILKSRG